MKQEWRESAQIMIARAMKNLSEVSFLLADDTNNEMSEKEIRHCIVLVNNAAGLASNTDCFFKFALGIPNEEI